MIFGWETLTGIFLAWLILSSFSGAVTKSLDLKLAVVRAKAAAVMRAYYLDGNTVTSESGGLCYPVIIQNVDLNAQQLGKEEVILACEPSSP